MKKAIIQFHSGNISIRECDEIEIVPGQVRLLNEDGEVTGRLSSEYIKTFIFDGHEFPLLKKIRKDRYK